jgi:membrane protein CcdC involved in cytochrome C biogenesis
MARPSMSLDRSLLKVYPLLANRRIRVGLFVGLMMVMFFFQGTTSLILSWVVFGVVFLSPLTERMSLYYKDRYIIGGKAYVLILKESFILIILCLVFISARILGYYAG